MTRAHLRKWPLSHCIPFLPRSRPCILGVHPNNTHTFIDIIIMIIMTMVMIREKRKRNTILLAKSMHAYIYSQVDMYLNS